jgi:broad specificity phosphatase PhoE
MRKLKMPRTLTLVRHGESESNAVKRFAEKGTPHPNEKALYRTHTSRRRLTAKGVKQALCAGEWLRTHFQQEALRRGEKPYEKLRGFFSPYARAMETGGHLGLPITWLPDDRLSERNWGDLDQLTHEERVAKYGDLAHREEFGIFWPAGNGETLQALATRMWQHFFKLKRMHEEQDIVEVSHGETILTQRFMLERWLPEDVVEMMIMTDTHLSKQMLGRETDWQNKLINCRIVQYTREREDGSWDEKYCRVRLVAPSAPDNPKKNLDWKPIVRRKFSTDNLLAYVDRFPHFLAEV